jgi:hypothetical protein
MVIDVDKLSEAFVKASEPITRVMVRDTSNNEIVYVRGFKTPVHAFRFNLPKGNYNVVADNNTELSLVRLDKPHYYKTVPMPTPVKRPFKVADKINRTVKNFKENGSPASIHVKTGTVETNKRFDTLPKYAREFIMAHEEGHLLYKAEQHADMYAVKKILEAGGNFSPCYITLVRVLGKSPINVQRLNNILKIGKIIN